MCFSNGLDMPVKISDTRMYVEVVPMVALRSNNRTQYFCVQHEIM